MGGIAGLSQEFESLREGQVRRAKRVLKVSERCILVELDTGKVAALGLGQELGRSVVLPDFGVEYGRPVIDGLVRLGVLSDEDRRTYLEAREAKARRRRQQWQLRDLRELLEKLGGDEAAMLQELRKRFDDELLTKAGWLPKGGAR